MRVSQFIIQKKLYVGLFIVCILLFVSACGGVVPGQSATSTQNPPSTPSANRPATPVAQPPAATPSTLPTPIAGTQTPSILWPTPPPSASPTAASIHINMNRPVLAFYYMWYNSTTWSKQTMSDLPTTRYTSSDDSTINQQVTEAAQAGITGFISSWWGPGDATDTNFFKLLAHSATLQQTTGYPFASSIYFESDAPAFNTTPKIVSGLQYAMAHYANDPHFFHWHGKPVFFFWDPLGNHRTLADWSSIRRQVDPNNQMIWSAEGVDNSLLSVFDGIHLFSAAYWGIQHNDITQVDQGFRKQIDTYNQANHTQKIWVAGVLPGYDDTRVPGRTGTYIVPRNNGATYRSSWTGALASSPDWVTITSFNEWFEGAMIEPSVTYNTQYLTLTHQFAQKWHG